MLCMNQTMKSVTLVCVVALGVLLGRELQGAAAIVDMNEGATLQNVIGAPAGDVAIFGSTPSFRRFLEFRREFLCHLDELVALSEAAKAAPDHRDLPPVRSVANVKLHKALNHVKKRAIIDAVLSFGKREFGKMGARLVEPIERLLIELFLEEAIDRRDLLKHVKDLIGCSQAHGTLVHVFVPYYFGGVSDTYSSEYLQLFLRVCAEFYLNCYGEVGIGPNLVLALVIPPVGYVQNFMALDATGQNDAIYSSIADVLENCVIDQCTGLAQFYLINQNGPQNEVLIAELRARGYGARSFHELLEIVSFRGLLHAFTPYTYVPAKSGESISVFHRPSCLLRPKRVLNKVLGSAEQINASLAPRKAVFTQLPEPAK